MRTTGGSSSSPLLRSESVIAVAELARRRLQTNGFRQLDLVETSLSRSKERIVFHYVRMYTGIRPASTSSPSRSIVSHSIGYH
jgi:hypothetical protein